MPEPRLIFFIWPVGLVGVFFMFLGLTAPKKPHSQQLVYTSQVSLPSGERVGIFLPTIPIAIGLRSKSGSRVLTIGDVLHCEPFVDEVPMFHKSAAGELEPSNVSQEMLNCGPPAAGEPDRILAVIGIQWRYKEE